MILTFLPDAPAYRRKPDRNGKERNTGAGLRAWPMPRPDEDERVAGFGSSPWRHTRERLPARERTARPR